MMYPGRAGVKWCLVLLVDGQSARGLRVAISRAATSRGMTVETAEGDGFVAVRKVEEP